MKQPKQPGFFRITDAPGHRVLFVPTAHTSFEVLPEAGRLNVMGASLYMSFNLEDIVVETVSMDAVEDSILTLLDGIRKYLLKEVVTEEGSEATTE